MEQIAVIPIPSRDWKVKKTRETLVYGYRDTARKKDQRKVDERLHYMWFKYLQLCLDLERITMVFQRGVVEVKSFPPQRSKYQNPYTGSGI